MGEHGRELQIGGRQIPLDSEREQFVHSERAEHPFTYNITSHIYIVFTSLKFWV